MYGNTQAIRALAMSLDERAEDIDASARLLLARAEVCGWAGVAAEAMRAQVGLSCTRLRMCADQHRTAAEMLRAHAVAVDEAKELIAWLEKKASSLVDGARSKLDAAAGKLMDLLPGERVLARFDPPPSGHVKWLTIDLPGLR